MLRTHTCGELNLDNLGQKVVISGWLTQKREMGPMVFLILSDRYGMTQVFVSDPVLAESAKKSNIV